MIMPAKKTSFIIIMAILFTLTILSLLYLLSESKGSGVPAKGIFVWEELNR